jgi:predicted adenine nucleotide alpha hydrolase (AANH) superfamily ATPase
VRILLHMCCGPCGISPLRELLKEGHDVTGWFYNPNIHPLAEYLRRREGAMRVAAAHDGIAILFPPETEKEYDVTAWCREALAFDAAPDASRCAYCRESRFDRAAKEAKKQGFDAFTSSLLYSRRQNHEDMKEAGEKAAAQYGAAFLYRDFRPLWQEGINASKELGIYRQQYCGCVFSEEDRYKRELEKATVF